MIYTRHIPVNQLLDTIDLNIATHNPNRNKTILNAYLSFLSSDIYMPIYALDVTYMDGFCEIPDRYWIQANTKRIAVYVNYDPDNITQRFIWSSNNSSTKIALTTKIESDSIVFLEVQGDTLSYGNDKLLFIENSLCNKHPINIAFIDNFGLPQVASLESGAFSNSDNTENTFKSISGEIEYALDKTPANFLTVGSNTIARQLQLFLTGLVNSRCYQILLNDNSIIDTFMSDVSLTADRYTSTYAFSGKLSFNTSDLASLQYNIGELNIND